MQLDARFKVSKFENPSGETVYRVSGTGADGARVRANFPSREEAEGECAALNNEFTNEKTTVRPRLTRLTDEELHEAESAFKSLAGKSITAAVAFYLENYREPINQISLREAFDKFIEAKIAENSRDRTVKDLRSRIGAFVLTRGSKDVSQVLDTECAEHIARDGSGHTNQRNDRAALNNFFNWCMGKKYCASNPIENLSRVKLDEKDPEALPLAKARALMDAAATLKGGKLVPFFSLALFAGLRPESEIRRIAWSDIDLTQKTIRIRGTNKTRRRRVIEMPDNLVKWLTPHALKRSPIIVKNFRKDWDTVRRMAGFGTADKSDEETKHLLPWVEDYCRHTALSAHLAAHQNEAKTATWAGNTAEVVHSKYKSLMTEAEAKEFWGIVPDKRKIVAMAKAA